MWHSAATVGLLLLAPIVIGAQAPAPAVGLGFGIDTTIAEVHDIVALTRAYLANPDSTARRRGLWSVGTKLDARFGDLVTNAYQGFNVTILAVTPAFPGDSVYAVKLLHANSPKTGEPVSALALERLFAVRASGSPFGWQLAGALPRLTRDWARRNAGRITFWYAPGQIQSPSKARETATFVDSVGRLFSVRLPEHIDAYVTASTDEAWRTMGLDFFPDGSGPETGFGGRSIPRAGIVLIGDPRVGEDYLHEFVHVVLSPTLNSRTAAFNEGVAVWLGGHDGHPVTEMYTLLHKYQLAHPDVTIAQVLGGNSPGGSEASNAMYTTDAVIVEAIFHRTGIPGLLRFANVTGSATEVLARLHEFIGPTDTRGIDGWWRAETERLAKAH